MEQQKYLWPILFVVGGILVGSLLTVCLGWKTISVGPGPIAQKRMVHQMPDGTSMPSGEMPPSCGMQDMMQGMNAGLQGKTGDAFDQEFLSEMVIHHQGAIDMAKMVPQMSKRPELLKLAQDIIEAQSKEITQMQEWQTQWYR